MERQTELTVPQQRVWDRPAVTVPVFAAFSLVGGQLPSFSPAANLYSVGLGGTMIWLGLSNRVARRPPPARPGPGAVWWLVPVLVFGAFESSTFLLGSNENYPTLSKLTDPLLVDPMIRSIGYFGWLTAFWGLVRR